MSSAQVWTARAKVTAACSRFANGLSTKRSQRGYESTVRPPKNVFCVDATKATYQPPILPAIIGPALIRTIRRFRSDALSRSPPHAPGDADSAGATRNGSVMNWLLLGAVWVIMVILINPSGEFPLNDDWVYALAVKSILETGRYQLSSPTTANVFTQIWWGALFCLPFGFSYLALRISTMVLGLGGVLAMHASLKELGANARVALLGALVLACDPFYLGLSCSFMTDVPFEALVIIGSYLMIRGLRRDRMAFMVAGILVLFADVLIRQLAVVVLLGFAVGYVIRFGMTRGNLIKAAIPVLAGTMLHFGYQHWLVASGRAPYFYPPTSNLVLTYSTLTSELGQMWYRVQTVAPYVGFAVFPFLLMLRPIRQTGRTGYAAHIAGGALLAGTVAFIVTCLWRGILMPMRPSYLVEPGFGPLVLKDVFPLHSNMPPPSPYMHAFWTIVTIEGTLGAFCVACYLLYLARDAISRVWRTGLPRDLWPDGFIVTAIATYAAILLVIDFLFDRYVMFLTPLVLLLLAAGAHRATIVRPGAGFRYAMILTAGYAAFSVASVHDYFSWNRARWVALDYLTDDLHVSPNRIDGGFEFNGLFLHDFAYKPKPHKSWWWVDDDEFAVTFRPLPGYEVMRRYPVDRWLPVWGDLLILHRNEGK
jgi:hypothetical protein